MEKDPLEFEEVREVKTERETDLQKVVSSPTPGGGVVEKKTEEREKEREDRRVTNISMDATLVGTPRAHAQELTSSSISPSSSDSSANTKRRVHKTRTDLKIATSTATATATTEIDITDDSDSHSGKEEEEKSPGGVEDEKAWIREEEVEIGRAHV